jgi:hypothetical protein
MGDRRAQNLEDSVDCMADDADTKIIRTYDNEIMAEMAREVLARSGIVAVVHKDDCGGMRPHMQPPLGVYLVVNSADFERAESVLCATEGPQR